MNVFLRWGLYVLAFLLPLLLALKTIYFGEFHFWYDIARDLLLAQQNLLKPTLIGPPSGIPGLFYGPYWIWLLSLGLMVSNDVRVVTFVAGVIPYLVIFPLIFFSFKRIFATDVLLVLWSFFILGFISYATNLWNPNLAPLIFLAITLLITHTKPGVWSLRQVILLLSIGFLSGVLINFHISFGTGVIVGTVLFLLYTVCIEQTIPGVKKLVWSIFILGIFGVGCGLAFVPLFLFEVRHGFHQLQALAYTLQQSVLHNSAVVGQVGLDKEAIIGGFLGRIAPLLQTPLFLGILLEGMILGYIICLKRYNLYHVTFSVLERKLIAFLCCVSGSILFVYLSTKNPVWDYHFIGIEIILLFILGIIMQKSIFFKKVMTYLLFLIILLTCITFLQSWQKNSETQPGSYAALLKIVIGVILDTKGKPFTYYVATPSIYSYDYDYLFSMLKANPLSVQEKEQASYIYIIIPEEQQGDTNGFLENKTPAVQYKTTNQWNGWEGTKIYRREKITIEK